MYQPPFSRYTASSMMQSVKYTSEKVYAFVEAKLSQNSEIASISQQRLDFANRALNKSGLNAASIIEFCENDPNFKEDYKKFIDTQFNDACRWILH